MKMMNWVAENWFLLVALAAVLGVSTCAVYCFVGLPTEKQLGKIKEWLLYAVTMAERELGGGTGRLKLRYVYDWFLKTFPWLAKVVSFELFSSLVDEALEEMKRLMESNTAVSELVMGEQCEAKSIGFEVKQG